MVHIWSESRHGKPLVFQLIAEKLALTLDHFIILVWQSFWLYDLYVTITPVFNQTRHHLLPILRPVRLNKAIPLLISFGQKCHRGQKLINFLQFLNLKRLLGGLSKLVASLFNAHKGIIAKGMLHTT